MTLLGGRSVSLRVPVAQSISSPGAQVRAPDDARTADRLGGTAPESLHDATDGGNALGPRQRHASLRTHVEAEPAIDALQIVEHGLAARTAERGQVGEDERRPDPVLVPNQLPHRVSQGFLEPEREPPPASRAQFHGLVGYPLETGKGLRVVDAQFGGHPAEQTGGHDGGDDEALPLAGSVLGQHVVGEHGSDLVAGQRSIGPVTIPYDRGQAIRIGIVGQDEIGPLAPGEIEGQIHGPLLLRVRERDRGEFTVRLGLLGNDMEARVPGLSEDPADPCASHAVERAVDDREVRRALGMPAQGQDSGQIALPHRGRHVTPESAAASLRFTQQGNVANRPLPRRWRC